MTLLVYTVNGTNFGPGPADPRDPGQYPVQVAQALLPTPWQYVADALDGLETRSLVDWVPIAYPAQIYPMGASADAGTANLAAAIAASPVGTPKALAGYSQGALPTSTVWRDYILNPNGPLHAYLNDFVAAVNWGNPMRCPGIANGNTFAGWAIPSGGGISGPNNLTADQTPNWWLDFANPNDLYTDCPAGTQAGADETLIYNLIVTKNFGGTLAGLIKIIESLVGQFHQPLIEVIGIATAVWNGLRFVGAGPAAGHYTYNIGPAIAYLHSVATQHA